MIQYYNPVGTSQLIEIGPKEVPNGATNEYTQTLRVRGIRITNNTSGSITIHVYDGQTPPIDLIPLQPVAPNGGWVQFNDNEEGALCPGGITWAASDAGLQGYIKGHPA